MKQFALILISGYQKLISSDHRKYGAPFFVRCRFYPSCSEYAKEAISQYGLFTGFMFLLWRILRCNPWSRGGYDPLC